MKNMFTLKLGYSCNSNCIICCTPFRSKDEVSTEEAKKVILEAGKRGVVKLIFSGGEPTIRNDFLELLSYACKNGIKDIEVQTNGRMFYYKEFAKKVSEIERSNVNLRFIIPLFSHDPEIHDFITGVNGSFEQTIEGIRNLLSFNQDVFGKIVITKFNYRDIENTVKLMISLGLGMIVIIFICISGKVKKNPEKMVPRYKDIVNHLKKALKTIEDNGRKSIVSGVPMCLMGKYRKYILESHYDKIVFKFPKAGISEIDDGMKYVKPKKCENCKLYSQCSVRKDYLNLYGDGELLPLK